MVKQNPDMGFEKSTEAIREGWPLFIIGGIGEIGIIGVIGIISNIRKAMYRRMRGLLGGD